MYASRATISLIFLIFFLKSAIYYMECEGRPWQVHSTYLDKERGEKEKRKEGIKKRNREGKRGDGGCASVL